MMTISVTAGHWLVCDALVSWGGGQEFAEALAGLEACAMVFHGFVEPGPEPAREPAREGVRGGSASTAWREIRELLGTCFDGCVEVSRQCD